MPDSVGYIRERLFLLQDAGYRDFNAKLIPNIHAGDIIGVRSPALKKLAAEIARSEHAAPFIEALPHRYLEENILHACLIARERDFDACVMRVDAFLPYIDNWAVCDSLSPAVFKRQSERLLPYIERWLGSDRPYTVRYGIGCLMRYFLDEQFDAEYLDMAASVHSDEYYVNMMRAWYFATALAKQYPAAIRYIEERRLDTWTHNKSIQKAVESYRVSDEHKAYLKTLRIKQNDRRQH